MKPAFDPSETEKLYPHFLECSDSVSHCPVHPLTIGVKVEYFVHLIARRKMARFHLTSDIGTGSNN